MTAHVRWLFSIGLVIWCIGCSDSRRNAHEQSAPQQHSPPQHAPQQQDAGAHGSSSHGSKANANVSSSVASASAASASVASATGEERSGNSTVPLSYPVDVVDRLKRTVRFESPPKRIVSLSPESTELLFALELGPKIVGVTEFCDHPSEASSLPKVGLGTAESISRESVVQLNPDLVIARWDTHSKLITTLERLGIKCVALGPQTIDQLCEEATLIGKFTGHQPQARQFVAHLRNSFRQLQSQIPSKRLQTLNDELHQNTAQTVYYELWHSPPMTAGPNSFIGELLSRAGLKNIFDDTKLPSPQINFEAVLERNPDIILVPSHPNDTGRIDAITKRPGWQSVKAIHENRIYLINGDTISRCGPRIIDAFQELLEKVYPDVKFEVSNALEEPMTENVPTEASNNPMPQSSLQRGNSNPVLVQCFHTDCTQFSRETSELA